MPVPQTTDAARQFEQYRHDVYAWASRLLGRHHDALDVAQDVFLRWVSQSRDAAPHHPRSWLRRVTVNRAIDLLRTRRSASGLPADLAEADVRRHRSLAEAEELRSAIGEAMSQLSEMQRCVLTAKVFDGLTFAKIAEEYGLAVPTAKTHYLRALRAVRDRLQPEWRPEGAES
ncbi:MAG: sigma-70 family RNA polymerase sigma factor [Phycisphaerales bacterium]|nr:MAG: sigma-70 family RNA polymerase sigma factor [Phycisphaerales bacterium]